MTSTTTRKRPPAEAMPRDHEAEHAAAVKASRDALADAEARVRELRERDAERVQAEDIRSSWAQGDDVTYSGLDLAVAKAEAEKSGVLLAYRERVAERARRALVVEDIALAQAVADALTGLLGVPARATALPPNDGDYADLPELVVHQAGEHHSVGVDGALSGVVTVHYRRSALHARLDGKAIMDALDLNGWRFPTHAAEVPNSFSLDGGVVHDELVLEVGRGYPNSPALPAELDLDAVAGNLAGSVREAYAEYSFSVLRSNPRVSVAASAAAILGDTSNDDGVRVIVAEVEGVLSISGGFEAGPAIADLGDSLAKLAKSSTVIGRVQEAELIHAGPATADGTHLTGLVFAVRVTGTSAAVAT